MDKQKKGNLFPNEKLVEAVKIAPTDPTEEFAFNPRAAVQDLSIEELRVLRTVRDRMRELSAGGSNGN